jgi:hypothetical protein
MSFWKRLFGKSSGGASGSFAGETREYSGHVIHAEPIKDNGQWRLAGRITKDVDGETKEHKFVRADLFSSRDDAVSFAFQKGELIIQQMGKTLYS